MNGNIHAECCDSRDAFYSDPHCCTDTCACANIRAELQPNWGTELCTERVANAASDDATIINSNAQAECCYDRDAFYSDMAFWAHACANIQAELSRNRSAEHAPSEVPTLQVPGGMDILTSCGT